MEYGYFISEKLDPYWNLAIEQLLFDSVDKNMAVIYLWQNDNTIVVGRNQDVYIECKVDDFVRQGGKIARRKSGGGAVYHDLGNLNYSVLFCEDMRCKVSPYDMIIKVMRNLGVNTTYNGRNDILYDGRKISGNAAYTNSNIVCHHGTLLVNTDISQIENYLTPPDDKLKRNQVPSVASRVINISDIDERITVTALKEAIIEYTHANVLEKTPELPNVKKLYSFFADRMWIFGGTK